MRKLLFTLITLTCLSIPVRAQIFDGRCGDNLSYHLNLDYAILTIEGSGDMYDYDYSNGIFAPWAGEVYYEVRLPYGLTSIGSDAFSYSWLCVMDIPNTVTDIGARAFHSASLDKVVIPSSVTRIGD